MPRIRMQKKFFLVILMGGVAEKNKTKMRTIRERGKKKQKTNKKLFQNYRHLPFPKMWRLGSALGGGCFVAWKQSLHREEY